MRRKPKDDKPKLETVHPPSVQIEPVQGNVESTTITAQTEVESPPSKYKKGDIVAQTKIQYNDKTYRFGDVIPNGQPKLNTKRLLASKKIKIY